MSYCNRRPIWPDVLIWGTTPEKVGAQLARETFMKLGATDVAVYSVVAKVYLDSNRNAQHFLETFVYDHIQGCAQYDCNILQLKLQYAILLFVSSALQYVLQYTSKLQYILQYIRTLHN